MGGRPLPDTAKKRVKRAAYDARVQKAVDAYRDEMKRPLQGNERRRGARFFAGKDICHGTIVNLASGKRSLTQFNITKRKLTPAQELKIVELCELSADRGFPLTHAMIRNCATAILEAYDPTKLPLGKNWVDRFLDRNRDRLQSHWSRPLDTVRANAASPENVKHFMEKVVYPNIVEPNIAPELIEGFDEAGFFPGSNESQVVIARRGGKVAYKQGTENRETVTTIVTICADGTWRRPLIIFKAKKFQKAWQKDNVAKCSFAHSATGWTESAIALDFLRAWDKETEGKAAGRTRVLFVDGHASHLAPAFIRYGLEHNIVIIAYSPHTTHILQGLDVACFGIVKRRWSDAVREHEEKNGPLKKADFAGVFGRVLMESLTRETVLSAFSSTGIYPYNPTVISPDKLGPSKANSVRGSFPQAQSVATRTVLAAFSTLTPTAFDRDTETHLPPALPDVPATQFPQPSTPSRRRPLVDLDPALFTPSKRIRTLNAALVNTTTASYLVSADRITAAKSRAALKENEPVLQSILEEMDEPEWPLLQKDTSAMTHGELEQHVAALTASLRRAKDRLVVANAINEDSTAQLILQNLHLNKLTEALHGKENKEPNSRSHFPSGHGRVLTDENFVQSVEAEDAKRKAAETAKAKRRSARESKKAKKAEIEAVWQQWMAEWKDARTKWETTCAELKANKARAKDMPLAPKKPARKDLPPLDEDDGQDDEDAEEEEESW